MDPGTGNIYTKDEAEKLGHDPDDLIPLGDNEAMRLLKERTVHAQVLAEKRRAVSQKRRDRHAEMHSHAETRNKAQRTARRGNR